MIWQYNATAIVMITKIKEKNKVIFLQICDNFCAF